MSQTRYRAKVMQNGFLSLPKDAELQIGEEVEVVIKRKRTPTNSEPQRKILPAALRKVLDERQQRIDELMTQVPGPKDLARNWSYYLYGKKPQ